MTPNLPEAICLIFEVFSVPCLDLASPPSPELDLAPNEFIASARVSCASGDKAPKLIPAESNLLRIADIGSTFSRLRDGFEDCSCNKSLNIEGFLLLTKSVNLLKDS